MTGIYIFYVLGMIVAIWLGIGDEKRARESGIDTSRYYAIGMLMIAVMSWLYVLIWLYNKNLRKP